MVFFADMASHRLVGRYVPAAGLGEGVAGRVPRPLDESRGEVAQAFHEPGDVRLAAQRSGSEPLGQAVEAGHLLVVDRAWRGYAPGRRTVVGAGDDQHDVLRVLALGQGLMDGADV